MVIHSGVCQRILRREVTVKINRESFKTGIPIIDRQHEAYLDLVDEVFRLCQQETVDRTTLGKEVNGALTYALEHFDTEEHLMRSVHYPRYVEHVAKHDTFRGQVDKFIAELQAETTIDGYMLRMTKWLVEWLSSHVQADDVQLATFLRKTGEHAGHTPRPAHAA
jgi:hemerythrin